MFVKTTSQWDANVTLEGSVNPFPLSQVSLTSEDSFPFGKTAPFNHAQTLTIHLPSAPALSGWPSPKTNEGTE